MHTSSTTGAMETVSICDAWYAYCAYVVLSVYGTVWNIAAGLKIALAVASVSSFWIM